MPKYVVRSNSHDEPAYAYYDGWATYGWTHNINAAFRFPDKMSAYRALRDMMNLAFDRNEEPCDMSIMEVE